MGTYLGCISCMSHEVFYGANLVNLEAREESEIIKKKSTDFKNEMDKNKMKMFEYMF